MVVKRLTRLIGCLILVNKFDIFAALKAFDKKDYTYGDKPGIDTEALNQFCHYSALRWMSGAAKDKDHALALLSANVINQGYFTLSNIEGAQAKALASVGTGQSMRHIYVKASKKPDISILYEAIRNQYGQDYEDEDCDVFLGLIDRQTLSSFISQQENNKDLFSAYELWLDQKVDHVRLNQ